MTRTERTYDLVQALYHFSCSFPGPVHALFLLSRGLDLLEINLVLATYLITAFVFELGFAVSEPVFLAWTNEHAPPERRATVLSMRAMALTLGGGVGLCGMGLIARSVGIAAAWLASAIVLGLAVPGFFWLGRATGSGQPEFRRLAVPR